MGHPGSAGLSFVFEHGIQCRSSEHAGNQPRALGGEVESISETLAVWSDIYQRGPKDKVPLSNKNISLVTRKAHFFSK